jgi:hypothetical protein
MYWRWKVVNARLKSAKSDEANDILAALAADAADERRYKLLAPTTDEEDDRVIEIPTDAPPLPRPPP